MRSLVCTGSGAGLRWAIRHLIVLSDVAVICALEIGNVHFAVVAQVEGHLHADSVPIRVMLQAQSPAATDWTVAGQQISAERCCFTSGSMASCLLPA